MTKQEIVAHVTSLLVNDSKLCHEARVYAIGRVRATFSKPDFVLTEENEDSPEAFMYYTFATEYMVSVTNQALGQFTNIGYQIPSTEH